MNDSDDLVRPIPTRRPYPTPDGYAVPVWVTRNGHHIGDAELVLTHPDELDAILANPEQAARIATHVRAHPGTRLRPASPQPDS